MMSEDSSWSTHGCTVEEVQVRLQEIGIQIGVHFQPEWLMSMPQLSYDPVSRRLYQNHSPQASHAPLKKRKVEKKKLPEDQQKKKKVTAQPDLVRTKELEDSILRDHRKNHFVDELYAERANFGIGSLRHYLEVTFAASSVKASVHVVGSFAAGLASRTESSIDVAVRLAGGDLTKPLSPSDLAQLVHTAMDNCPFFAIIKRKGDLIECVVDYSFVIVLHVFNGQSFPMHWLHHSRMLASISRASPLFTLMVCYVKSWARANKLIGGGSFHLGGYGWTMLVAAFMISERFVVNPIEKSGGLTEQFGAQPSQCYTFVGSVSSDSPTIPLVKAIRSFFVWLANRELTLNTIYIEGLRAPVYPGWITVIDPITDSSSNEFGIACHEEAIIYSLAVAEAAKQAVALLK
jgi:hypothetical protein